MFTKKAENMKNNYKKGISTLVMILIIVVIGALIWLFAPKDFLTPKGAKTNFSKVRMGGGAPKDALPGPLKWKKSFAYEKDDEKQGRRPTGFNPFGFKKD